MDWFLFDHRMGTSGSFSSAFVVLARAAGIPARVVSGWVIARQEDTQTVYRSQVYQWAEIALDGLGWVTVDPVPWDAFTDDDVDHALGVALEEAGSSAVPEVREAVAALWGNTNDTEALLLLFRAIDDTPDANTRAAAQSALGTLALDHFTEILLAHDDPLMRAAAAYGLEVLADPGAVESLLQALAVDEDARVRAAAVDALAVLGKDEAEEPLLLALGTDENAEVRAAAARALGALKSAWTAEGMTSSLRSDPEEEVRAEIALALGEIRNSIALLPLLDARSDDGSADVRAAASAALTQWDFPALLEVLQSAEDPAQRAAAAELMGERGYADAIHPLGEALSDPAEEVRRAARAALEKIGEIDWLENGGGILTYDGDIAFIPRATAETAHPAPHTPVFQVEGASHTSLLRVAVGDIYLDGTWIPDEQEGLGGGVNGVAFRPDDILPHGADAGRLDDITLSAGAPGQRILPGRLPTSLHAEWFSSRVTYWLQSHTVTSATAPLRHAWNANVHDYSLEQLNAAETWPASDRFPYMELPRARGLHGCKRSRLR